MNCPKCRSGNIDILDSRRHEDCVKRRRMCLDCGFRYSTIEINVDEYKTMQEKVNFLHTLMQKVKETADDFYK